MKLKTGKTNKSFLVALYGVPGIGKTTTACMAPNTLGIDLEDGMNEVGVPRNEDPIKTTAELKDALRFAYESDFQTIVVDSATQIEKLLTNDVLEEMKIKSIDEPDWGAGYARLKAKWIDIINNLRTIKEKGKNVILIAHSRIGTVTEPDNEPYDAYTLDVYNKAIPFIVSEMDAVFFAQHEMVTKVVDGKKDKRRGVSTGKRIVRTQKRAAWEAKNRYSLPDTLPLSPELWSHLKYEEKS